MRFQISVLQIDHKATTAAYMTMEPEAVISYFSRSPLFAWMAAHHNMTTIPKTAIKP